MGRTSDEVPSLAAPIEEFFEKRCLISFKSCRKARSADAVPFMETRQACIPGVSPPGCLKASTHDEAPAMSEHSEEISFFKKRCFMPWRPCRKARSVEEALTVEKRSEETRAPEK